MDEQTSPTLPATPPGNNSQSHWRESWVALHLALRAEMIAVVAFVAGVEQPWHGLFQVGMEGCFAFATVMVGKALLTEAGAK